MQPSLDQLLQFARTLAHDYDFVRVVLATTPSDLQDHSQLDVQFVEVSDGPDFRTDLVKAQRDGPPPWDCWEGLQFTPEEPELPTSPTLPVSA